VESPLLDVQLNERQEKALLRMFEEGPEGFRGGLSAGEYSAITGAYRQPPHETRRIWLPKAHWFVKVNGVTPAIFSAYCTSCPQ
jgi:hypothetical protein